MHPSELLGQPVANLADAIAAHAGQRPDRTALRVGTEVLTWAELHRRIDAAAAALQRDGARPGDRIVTLGLNRIAQLTAMFGALRAGMAYAPLPTTATAEQLARMVADVQPTHTFTDPDFAHLAYPSSRAVSLHEPAFADWLGAPGAKPQPVAIDADTPFNIIYSSGTTGTPKGIVHPHGMRWAQVRRGPLSGYDNHAVTLLATALCSNTTLVGLITTLGQGGTVVLMRKFDAGAYLDLAEQWHPTHTYLVPIQYQRILAHPSFDGRDLGSFRFKMSTGAHMPLAVKRELMQRWPGALHDSYGLTEGGVYCLLDVGQFPDKLHTVGRPPAGYDMRVIDEAGRELPRGAVGEVIGRSASMMKEYFRLPEKTREIEWFDPQGQRFLRTGDLGRFDDDGFLELAGRRKEMINSGGYNIYPKDLEEVLLGHPDVIEAAVVGVPSERWGETPVGFVVLTPQAQADEAALLAWANARLGATQRLSALHVVPEVPRNAMGKMLKTTLQAWATGAGAGRPG